MRIEDLSVALRPRSSWEAVELGFALARRHYGVILKAWLITSLPVLALLTAVCWPLDLLWLPIVLMWWLKPLFERLPLLVISRGVFGQPPGLQDSLRQQAAMAGPILPWLLWRRLSPSRSLLMPVDLLEGVRGKLRSARCSALARNASGHAALLLLVLLHVEFILSFAVLLLVLMLVPVEFLDAASKAMWETLFEDPPAWAEALLGLLSWLCMSLVAPFYVGGGFGLYLNRRTQIEAWDIELGFRRLAARLAQREGAGRRGGGAAAALLLCALIGSGFSMTPAWADEGEDRPGPGGQVAPASGDRFQQVFAHEHQDGTDAFVEQAASTYEDRALNPIETRRVWMPRKNDTPELDDRPDLELDWMHSLGRGFAWVFEHILWILAGLLLVLLLATHRRWLPALGGEALLRSRPRTRDEALAADHEPLPADIAAAARALWQQGAPRAALALLYAGGVERVVASTGEPLPPGSTEADCLRRARRLGAQGFGALFPRIVRSWQAAAYAARLPQQAEFEALLRDWNAPEPSAPAPEASTGAHA